MKVEIDECMSVEMWGPGIYETPNLKTLVEGYKKPIVLPLDGPCAINEAMEKLWRKHNQVITL